MRSMAKEAEEMEKGMEEEDPMILATMTMTSTTPACKTPRERT
jgi:hypothetical protein